MDGVPFEFLDPCCQKDVLEQRREQKLKARLSTTDPSLKKERQIENVFTGIFKSPTCHTCCAPRDYALLLKIRAQAKEADEALQQSIRHEASGISDEDSDFSDIDLDDGFMSARELELKEKVVLQSQKEKLGLGIHVEDSSAHILSFLEEGVKLIVHIYDPASTTCAKLDLSLEIAAKRFLATRFRRIATFDAAELLCTKYSLPRHAPLLACFSDKRMVSFTSDLTELVPNGEINSNNLYRFLDNSKVAIEDDESGNGLTLSMSMLTSVAFEKDIDSDDANDADRDSTRNYCGEVGCSKQYVHTHISSSGEGVKSVFSGNAAGSEAFESDYFSRL